MMGWIWIWISQYEHLSRSGMESIVRLFSWLVGLILIVRCWRVFNVSLTLMYDIWQIIQLRLLMLQSQFEVIVQYYTFITILYIHWTLNMHGEHLEWSRLVRHFAACYISLIHCTRTRTRYTVVGTLTWYRCYYAQLLIAFIIIV